ncbi:TMV resistance protein N-like isoform X1 [Senna tora]|uniref:TMV resistance protein N-like isoform X1 n=1 Tax=Senna tora TaxID=362788 RepID=A0A834WA39_9FABA|nr:TMV resistance protein N-like isoform X1 [Senna tora]
MANPIPQRRRTHHVFLSFRGEDTRHTFTHHLYSKLKQRGIVTFMDNQGLKRGQEIAPELLRAIEESLFSIVVVSENYGSSTWCLEEVKKIVECRKVHGMGVFPVFYGVDPSDVRHQRGSFAEAFAKHEERFGEEKVRGWREALTQLANLSGWESKGRDEGELIESIVDGVWTNLRPKLPSTFDILSGIDSKVEEMNVRVREGLENFYKKGDDTGKPRKFCCFSI